MQESVDDYASQLFHKAYPTAQRGSRETEEMGQSVLSNQFVSGLKPELKTKLAGMEGDFEQLLVKARFEEAKRRDIMRPTFPISKPPFPNRYRGPVKSGPDTKPEDSVARPSGIQRQGQRDIQRQGQRDIQHQGQRDITCYTCGAFGHVARSCPRNRRAGLEEARGRPMRSPPNPNRSGTQVAAVVREQELQVRMQDRRGEQTYDTQRQELELEGTLDRVAATMHGLASASKTQDSQLGPTLIASIHVEGVPVQALLDTGSPATIISLDLILRVLAAKKPKEQTPEQWKGEMRQKLEPSTLSLQNYGGGRLELIRQISVTLTKNGHTTCTRVQVQKDAPVELLLGTDTLPQLGFALLEMDFGETGVDLLQKQTWKKQPKSDALTSIPDDPELINGGNQIPMQEEPAEVQTTVPGPELSQATAPRNESQQPARAVSSGEEYQPKDQLKGTKRVVRLLQAVRLPARHRKMLQARVEGYWDHGLAVFDPELDFTEKDGLNLAEAMVEQDKSQIITLIMENASCEPARLKKGRVLGQLSPAILTTTTDEEDILNEPASRVSTLTQHEQVASAPGDRTQQLLEDLQPESDTLSNEEREQWRVFLSKYNHLFALDKSELGSTNVITHSINTGDHPPIRQAVRRTPFALRQHVDDLVQEMLNQGIIQPSQSPWASPIVLVKKKDGTTRFCVDYRKLNSLTRKDVYPLPRIDDTLDLLSRSAYFTTLDLASGYWQVKMDEESREKTAFTTYSGLYEFNVMPFGLCNAPATFQRLMETILAGLTRKICMVYIDDILIFSRTFEEHLSHLEQVMDRLDRAGLYRATWQYKSYWQLDDR